MLNACYFRQRVAWRQCTVELPRLETRPPLERRSQGDARGQGGQRSITRIASPSFKKQSVLGGSRSATVRTTMILIMMMAVLAVATMMMNRAMMKS